MGFSIFVSVLFLLKFLFCSTKNMNSLTLKSHNSFQNKNKKTHAHFCYHTTDFKVATRGLKIQLYLHVLELPKKWPADELLKLRKSKF